MADSMLIDGLIKFCDEKSKNIKLKAEPQVFIEIKKALEEFKVLKENETEILLKDGQLLYQQGVIDGYAKAIDEFVERIKAESYNGYVTLEDYPEDTIESVALEDIEHIAEQLKAGGENEIN